MFKVFIQREIAASHVAKIVRAVLAKLLLLVTDVREEFYLTGNVQHHVQIIIIQIWNTFANNVKKVVKNVID